MTEEDDIDGLAGEYVLGSLSADERREADSRRRADRALEAAIGAWEQRLAPLIDREPGIVPPTHVYDRVLARIANSDGGGGGDGRPARPGAEVVPLRGRAGRWRVVAAGLVGLAACLALAIGWLDFVNVTPPQGPVLARMDCGGLYKDFWMQFDRDRLAKIPADQLAGLSRMALRAHDACQAGDEQDAKAIFEKLGRMQH
jgi:anti-sigma-K factor RskA